MPVLCGKCHNRHDTVDDVKVCYGLLQPAAMFSAPPVPPFVRCTSAQLDYVKLLHGDLTYASKLSKKACSRYIDDLKKGGARVSSPTAQPAAPDPKLNMFDGLISTLPDGRYAIRRDETEAFTFYRVKRHTRGKLNGALTIQSQHSERLIRRATKWPSGRWYFEEKHYGDKDRLLDLMLLVCIDPKTAAYNYAEQLNRCSICGKDLTDERSRYYGIGPDCETRHASHIEWVIDLKGMSYEQARARALV